MNKMRENLQRLHRGQSGAVALLCLAGALILLMMGLMLFDGIEAASNKVHVQAATDAAAHSQASVNARTMNMTAFANVGKRVNVGYVAAYRTIIEWLDWITAAGVILTLAICIGTLVPGLQFLGALCPHAAMITAGAACAWEREQPDRLILDKVVNTTFGPEIRGFHNYQGYMEDITPYWAWSKGVMSGFENRAPLTAGYPLPGEADSLGNFAKVPMRAEGSNNWDSMCEKANDTSGPPRDRWLMLGDFIIKNVLEVLTGMLKGYMDDALKQAFDDAGLGDAHKLLKDTEKVANTAEATIDAFDIEDADCDELAELAEQDDNAELNDCSGTPEGESCTPTLIFHDEVVELGEGCKPLSEDAKNLYMGLRSITDAAGVGCDKFMTNPQLRGGYYGAIFASGMLALLVNWDGLADGGGYIQRKFIEYIRSGTPNFSRTCDNLRSSDYGFFSEAGQAYVLEESNWLMDSSNLMLGYNPNAIRNKQMSENYFMAQVNPATVATESSGSWGMSRGELTWQGDTEPNMWESKWAARVRPVALPNEWDSGPSMQEMVQQMNAEMLGILDTAHQGDFVGRGAYDDPGQMAIDLEADVERGFSSMGGSSMSGVGK